MWHFYQKIGFPKHLWDAIIDEADRAGVHPAKWIRDALAKILGV